ncbi:MAG TPA: prephenate dehydrogenase [Streptosporangiaceae bacterium]|nr:prephenate dehydrogenase [Streptosporangiaceae bacterium]
MAPGQLPASVVVIGTGLIGTSIALALRERGVSVWLADADAEAVLLAADLGAGQPLPADSVPNGGPADVAVLAVPPAAVATELCSAQARGLARVYTDVASVKELPLTAARKLGCDLASYLPGHPLAGRERSGPAAARADLFVGRPWVLCPQPVNDVTTIRLGTGLAEACGALPVAVPSADHDQWVALVSHAPHLVAAAMAARLEHAPGDALSLAGQGLRDVTRIAASGAGMWLQILTANAGPASAVVRAVARDLAGVADALASLAGGDEQAIKFVADLLERGGHGVHRIPGKHGGPTREFAAVHVVIPDRPGELARLFRVAEEAGINIEDVSIEHSPGLPVGVAELWVRPDVVAGLSGVLAAGGWPVRR